jgi:hypothetical protein
VLDLTVLQGRLAHDRCIRNHHVPEDGEDLLQPSSIDNPLPALAWFRDLSWDDQRKIHATIFVQVPRRLENAYAEAIGTALRCTAEWQQDAGKCEAAWKAVLLLPWLLMAKPSEQDPDESCASLLAERLARFWAGDVASLFREVKNTSKPRKRLPVTSFKKPPSTIAKRVATLVKAVEVGRALQAAHQGKALPVTQPVVETVRGLFPRQGLVDDTAVRDAPPNGTADHLVSLRKSC